MTTTTTTTLPTLAGSEKQIAWANEIRDRKLAEIAAIVASATPQAGATDEKVVAGLKLLRRIHRSIANQPKSAYWIDRRDRPVGALLAEMKTIIEKADAAKAAAQ